MTWEAILDRNSRVAYVTITGPDSRTCDVGEYDGHPAWRIDGEIIVADDAPEWLTDELLTEGWHYYLHRRADDGGDAERQRSWPM